MLTWTKGAGGRRYRDQEFDPDDQVQVYQADGKILAIGKPHHYVITGDVARNIWHLVMYLDGVKWFHSWHNSLDAAKQRAEKEEEQ